MPRRLSEIMSTPLQGHAALISAFEPILLVTMPGVAEIFKSVIDKITYGTHFKHFTVLHANTANGTHDLLNTGINTRKELEFQPCIV
jgi:hypothetical protein